MPEPAENQWTYPFPREDWEKVPESIRAYIVTLQCRLEKLEGQVNRNSKNSNQPPSTDSPFKKSSTSSKKTPGKPGARKGHKGHRYTMLVPTITENLMPERCPCGGAQFDETTVFYTHQRIELPEIPPVVTHYHLHQGTCHDCGRLVQASQDQIPTEQRVGFGPRLTGFIALMAGILGASRRDIQRLLADVFAIPASLGGVQKAIDRASQAVEPHHTAIGDIARNSPFNHIDETSWQSLLKKLRWLWVMTNKSVAFFRLLPGRSRKDFEALIDTWKGILISDDYGLYRNWVNLRQTCLAHLIRKAQKLSESPDPIIAKFGQRIRTELKLACRMARPGHGPPTFAQWQAHYMRLVKVLFDHNERDDESGKLARALVRQLDSLWIFLEVYGVDPTNNHAERTLRFAVILREHGQGTKSEKGERWIERILSLRETCRLRGVRSFPILVDAISCKFNGQSPDLSWLAND